MRKWLCLLLCAVMIIGVCGCERELKRDSTPIEELTLNPGVLRVGMYMHVPPMEYTTEDTISPAGFDVEMAKVLTENMGIEVEFVDITKENLLPSLDAGIVDCVISSVEVTEQGQKDYHVTQPYADLSLVQDKIHNAEAAGKVAVFVSKKNAQLMLELDRGIKIIKKNGQLLQISMDCFGMDIMVPVAEEGF